MQRIIFSKQSDHDIDLMPLWYHWYTKVFKADSIIITPVKTKLSSIEAVLQFYQDKKVIVKPIEVDEWQEEFIWETQLNFVRQILRPSEPFVVLSADTDQFFEPVDDDAPSGEIVFQRINMIAAKSPTPETLANTHIDAFATYILVAGYRNTMNASGVWLTGHFDGVMNEAQRKLVRREFHLCLRGYEHFLEKFSTLAINVDIDGPAGGWKKLRKAYQQGGAEQLKREYAEWARWVGRDRPAPEAVSIFQSLARADAAEEPGPLDFPFYSSMVEPQLRLPVGGETKSLPIAIPRGDVEILQNTFKQPRWSFPRSVMKIEAPVIVDVGAQFGYFSLYMKALFPKAIVHCFEPFQPSADLLRFSASKLSAFLVHEVALSNSNKLSTLYLSKESSAGHSLEPMPERRDSVASVETREAGSAFEQLGIGWVDILKISAPHRAVQILQSLGPRLAQVKICMVEYTSEEERRRIDQLMSGFGLYDLTLNRIGVGLLKYLRIGE